MSSFAVENIKCLRRNNILFHNINFSLTDGDLLQIDGENGSGKSTLLRICAGLTLANEGNIFWENKNIAEARHEYQRNITYLGHTNGIKDILTAKENIDVIHALSGSQHSPDSKKILEQIGLPDMEDVLVCKMSAGQKRRLGLTRLIINSSKLWLLDEPFTSLDKRGKQIVENLIVEHCNKKGIAIFATHQVMEVKDYIVKHIHLGQKQ